MNDDIWREIEEEADELSFGWKMSKEEFCLQMGLDMARRTRRRKKERRPRVHTEQSHRKWDVSAAAAMFHAGKSDKEIAAACGVAVATIERWRSKAGFRRKK